MMMKLFETEKNLPFLMMNNISTNHLSLSVGDVPTSDPIAFDDLFSDVDVSHIWKCDHSIVNCANVISNRIATETRRSTGNMLFVPDSDTKTWIESFNIGKAIYKNIIVCESLKKNELRCAYWHNKDGLVIDGGIQLSPDGFRCLSNHKSYFTRCFML